MNSAIHPNDLLKFSAEQVARWMCKGGFSDYTGDILEGSVDGKKLLALKRSQLRNYFYGQENRASDFWNLLEAIRNNPASPAMDGGFGRSRPPPPRHGQMHLPPRPGNQGSRYPPRCMTVPLHNPNPQPIPYDDDSFSDDDTYMDDPVTLPDQPVNRSAAPGPPGNPPLQPRFSARVPEESPTQERPPPHYPSFQQERRPLHVHEPPRRPPKSPAKHPVRSSYDDHHLPMRSPQPAHDQLPVRPPPPPPNIVPSYPLPVKHPINDRQGSDKSNSSCSPVGSRPSSFKDAHTHIPNRQSNKSTESTGSTSSEDLAQIPRPSYTPSSGPVTKKIPDRMQKFPIFPSQHRPSLQFPMPGFREFSPASANQDGENALLQDLANALTKKFSQANPYLCSEPSQENPRQTSDADDESTDICRKPIFNPKHNAALDPAPLPTSLSQTSTHEKVQLPPRPGPKPNLARDPLPPQSFNPPTLPPKSAAVARRQITDATCANQVLDNLATEDCYEGMDQALPKSESARMVEQQLYFKNIDRKTAQKAISTAEQDGAFIVRPRPDFPSEPYALTLWAKSKFYNFIIRMRSDGEYALGKRKDDEQAFSSVSVMIEHYRKHDVVLAENEGSVKLTCSP